MAVSYAPESSLLLGLHDMDFSGVRNDKCHRLGQDTVKPITLTTCGPGFFTCHDGQCISMDQRQDLAAGFVSNITYVFRCNQISNCFDKSDEKKCVMVFMEVDMKNTSYYRFPIINAGQLQQANSTLQL